MKKYFLLVVLFMVMFLWWGHNVFGDDSLVTNDSQWQWIPTTPPPTTEKTPCPAGKDLWGHSHMNVLSTCVCDDWWKEVKGVCKDCTLSDVCCGVELNTDVPFIGKCLEDQAYSGNDPTVVSEEDAFPVLMSSLTQILVTVILIVSFLLIVIGGIMISTGNPKWGKDMIIKVIIGIALLGASGVILRLINPNFFG